MKVETWDLFFPCSGMSACLVMFDPLQPHGLKPTRLLWPWNFPGKNTGASCHFLLQKIRIAFVLVLVIGTSWADLNSQPHPSLNFPMKGFCGNLLKSLELLRHKSPVPFVTLWPLLQTPAFSYYLALVSFRYTGRHHLVTWLLTTCQYFKIQFVSWC